MVTSNMYRHVYMGKYRWQMLCNSVATGRPNFVMFLAFQTMSPSLPYSWLVAAAATNAAAASAVAAAIMCHETVPAA